MSGRRQGRGPYDPRYQVKQYVGVVHGRYASFRVFQTGDSTHYLFCQMDPDGCDTGLHVPVRKRELRRDVQSALANGCSIDAREGALV